VTGSFIFLTSYDNLDDDGHILMIMQKSTTYVLGWVMKEHLRNDNWMSKEGDIAIQKENGCPPVALNGRPKTRYLRPECEYIVIE
jgi:hypothetical protein